MFCLLTNVDMLPLQPQVTSATCLSALQQMYAHLLLSTYASDAMLLPSRPALHCTGPDGSVHQQVATALGFLCFANVPPPAPGPWAETHKMLLRALQAAAGMRESEEEAAGLQEALQGLDLDW
jgi:hypothetical protein